MCHRAGRLHCERQRPAVLLRAAPRRRPNLSHNPSLALPPAAPLAQRARAPRAGRGTPLALAVRGSLCITAASPPAPAVFAPPRAAAAAVAAPADLAA
eukprot:7567203-Pyramimonas_sp.AAC.1